MPTKQQRRDRRPADQKANLGQKEAEAEKHGKTQMSHMEGDKTRKPDKHHPTKRGTK